MTSVRLIYLAGQIVHIVGALDIDGPAESELAIACRRSMRTGEPVTISGDEYRVIRLNIDIRPGLVVLEVEAPSPTGALPQHPDHRRRP